MNFTNEQIDTNSLPSVLDVRFRNVEKADRKVDIIGTIIFFVILLIIPFVINMLSDDTWYYDYIHIILPIWLLLLCFFIFAVFMGYRHKGYAVRDKDILYKKGWIWRSTTVVPYNRIQHSEIDQGPIERMFGLSTLKIFTAGGSSSDLAIEGITPEKAHQIKDYIQAKVVGHDEQE